MENLLFWLRSKWPGVRGRRLIYERVGRVEARILELQIQTGRILNQIDHKLGDVAGRVEEFRGVPGAVEARILELQIQTGRILNQIDHKLGDVAGRVEEFRGVPGSVFESIAEAGREFGARLAKVDEKLGQTAATVALQFERSHADDRDRSEALRSDLLALRANLQEYRDEVSRSVERSRRELIDVFGAEFGHVVRQIEIESRDTRSEVRSNLLALRTYLQEFRDDVARSLDQSEREVKDTLGQLLKISTRAEQASEDCRNALDSSFGTLKEKLDHLLLTVGDTPDRFLSVEYAAKSRHADIIAAMPTADQLRAALEAHRCETLTKLDQLNHLRLGISELDRLSRETVERQRDLDVIWGDGAPPSRWPAPFVLRTDHPVASTSDDHRFPRGTANDNTRSPRFVATCERLFNRSLTHLDLGCAGGGLVRDFLLRGHCSMGLEGSDWSLKEQRAEWRTLGERLRTCDITRPFEILNEQDSIVAFDVISAWEVLEHLPEDRLPSFFDNVVRHLAKDGLFVASVALFEDRDNASGAVWHVTLKPAAWWSERLAEAGLEIVDSPFAVLDYVRGSGSGSFDWNAATQPDLGFHLVARVASEPKPKKRVRRPT